MYDDELIRPWFDHLVGAIQDVSLFDVHTHTGSNDPDGFKLSAQELLAELEPAGSRAAVMTMHEPGGYPPANDRVLAEAEASGGRLVAFCRLDPNRDPAGEARRCVEAGARGIKLHPRAEQFQLSDPEVDPIFAFAHERKLPVLIHAGRGIPTLGRDAAAFADRYPDARVVLAHAAICDLNWLWREMPRHPNLFIDTSWWNPTDLAALLALVPPGQLLYATDLPYFTPFMVGTMVTRYGYQVGLSDDQVRCILGAQAERLLAGEDPLEVGPAPGSGGLDYDIVLERVTTLLVLALARMLMGRTGYEPLQLARLACDVGDLHAPEADVCRNVLALLDRQQRFARANPEDGAPLAAGIRLVMLAACVARTPDVSLPRVPELEDADDFRRASAAGHRVIDLSDLQPKAPEPARDLSRSSGADHLIVDPGNPADDQTVVPPPR